MTQESPLWPTAYYFRAVIKKEWIEAQTTVKGFFIFKSFFFEAASHEDSTCMPERQRKKVGEVKLSYTCVPIFKIQTRWVKISLSINVVKKYCQLKIIVNSKLLSNLKMLQKIIVKRYGQKCCQKILSIYKYRQKTS